MKKNTIALLTASSLLGLTGAVHAGTVGLSGMYSGDFHFEGWAYPGGISNPPTMMGEGVERYTNVPVNQNWDWDFSDSGSMAINTDNDAATADVMVNYSGKVYFEPGDFFPAGSFGNAFDVNGHWTNMGYDFPYLIENWDSGAPVIDNGDGTYTAWLDLQIWNHVMGNPRAWMGITWDITDDGLGNLSMATYDADDNGYPGTVNYTAFPFPFEPRFDGQASVIPVPAAVWLFGSGLIGLVGIARRRDI